jgi:hypothetical protein
VRMRVLVCSCLRPCARPSARAHAWLCACLNTWMIFIMAGLNSVHGATPGRCYIRLYQPRSQCKGPHTATRRTGMPAVRTPLPAGGVNRLPTAGFAPSAHFFPGPGPHRGQGYRAHHKAGARNRRGKHGGGGGLFRALGARVRLGAARRGADRVPQASGLSWPRDAPPDSGRAHKGAGLQMPALRTQHRSRAYLGDPHLAEFFLHHPSLPHCFCLTLMTM